MKKIINFFAAILLVAVISCNNSGKKITLQPNFKAGDVYTLDYNINMDQDVMGMKNKIGMDMGYKLGIKDADPKTGFTIDMNFSRIAMNMSMAAMSINYDSEKKNDAAGDTSTGPSGMINKMMRTILGGMLNKSAMVKMTTAGEVKEVTGFKEIMEAVADSAVKAVPNMTKDQMQQSMGGAMNEEQIKSVFQQIFSIYPQKEVSMGETWTRDLTTSQNNIPMKISSTYKVVEINEKDNEIILDVNGKIATQGEGEIKQNGMTIKMNMTGTQSGKITVDTKTGFIKQGKLTQDMKAEMEMMGQKVPMDMKMVLNMTGKKA